jgi:hypothetical protein
MRKTTEMIIVRHIDKRYTYANYQRSCAMDGCLKKHFTG